MLLSQQMVELKPELMGWQNLKPLRVCHFREGVCLREKEKGRKKRERQRERVGEREKEPKSKVRVKPSWAPSAVKTTLSFEE